MAAHAIVPARYYIINFAALTVLMFLTVWVSTVELGWLNLPVALLIAITKATLIVLIFMDVRRGTQLVMIFAAAGFLWFLIMVGFTITDYAAQDMGGVYTEPLPGQTYPHRVPASEAILPHGDAAAGHAEAGAAPTH